MCLHLFQLLIHVGMVCHDSLKMVLTFHHLTSKSLSNLVQDISPYNPNGSCPHIVMFYGIHHFVTGKYALPTVPSCALLLCMTMWGHSSKQEGKVGIEKGMKRKSKLMQKFSVWPNQPVARVSSCGLELPSMYFLYLRKSVKWLSLFLWFSLLMARIGYVNSFPNL